MLDAVNDTVREPPTMDWNATNILRIIFQTNAVGGAGVGTGDGFSVTVSAGNIVSTRLMIQL